MNRRLPASLGTRDEDPLAVFVRGATVGAFVGAVIAGSTIWRRVRRHAASAPTASAPTASAPTARLARPRHVAPPVVGADPYRP
jgi:hypothetical protein